MITKDHLKYYVNLHCVRYHIGYQGYECILRYILRLRSFSEHSLLGNPNMLIIEITDSKCNATDTTYVPVLEVVPKSHWN